MPLSPTPRTTLHRLRERARTERGDLYAVLDAGLICHLGVVVDGAPVVLPTGYGRIGDTLYLHGSSANRSLLAAAGQEVCATITLLDGPVTDEAERLDALRAVTEQLAPGQWDYARQPTRKELAATAVLAVPLAEASVKVRSGPPHDEPEDYESGTWAGVIPAALTFGQPEPDPELSPAIPAPGHITALFRHLITRDDKGTRS